MKILTVIVAYNRCALLSRCLDYLQLQARLPDCIVVINNGSTDHTEAMLRDRGIRCITQENVGAAGGWHRGIQCALDEGFDAVWLMDDDGFPDQFSLEQLVAELVPGVACVSSAVLCENDRKRLVFPLPRLNARELPVIFSVRRKLFTLDEVMSQATGSLYPYTHFFNGALISIDAIKQVGNVDRDFFIFGEELDYLYRLRSVGAVYTVMSAHHYHPDVCGRPLSDAKVYYYIKNTLILNRRYFDWVPVRNVLTVAAALGRTARRNGWLEALAYLVGRNRTIFWTAIGRGLRGRVAKDFHG